MPRRRLVSLLLAVLATTPTSVAAAQQPDPCVGWTLTTIASGLGTLENLTFDGRGGLLLSSTDRNAVERLTPDGQVTTLVADVDRPGGLRVRDRVLFANSGNGLASGVAGTTDGTIQRIDLDTGERSTYADGLVMPNGLVFDQDGNAYTSRDVGLDGAVTQVPADDPASPRRFAEIADTNGMAISGDGRWLYTVSTFDAAAPLWRVALADPTDITMVASLTLVGVPPAVPIAKGLDDLTIDGDDVLYITANGAGEVLRVEPTTGKACVIASGLLTPSSVTFGAGPGWDATHLYVVGFDGTVHELAPPPGVVPAPVPVPRPAPVPPPQPPPAPPPPPDDLPVTGAGAGVASVLALAAALSAVVVRRRDRAARGSA